LIISLKDTGRIYYIIADCEHLREHLRDEVDFIPTLDSSLTFI